MSPTTTAATVRTFPAPVLPETRSGSSKPALFVRSCLPADAERLRHLFDRCTPSTRYDRFHAALGEIPPAYLRQVLSGHVDMHDALVVEAPRRSRLATQLVAIGSAARVPSGLGRTVEIAVLVEDEWQRQGLGTRLLTQLVNRARGRGIERVRWCLLNQGSGLVPTLRREFGPLDIRRDGEVITAEAQLRHAAPTTEETVWQTP